MKVDEFLIGSALLFLLPFSMGSMIYTLSDLCEPDYISYSSNTVELIYDIAEQGAVHIVSPKFRITFDEDSYIIIDGTGESYHIYKADVLSVRTVLET